MKRPRSAASGVEKRVRKSPRRDHALQRIQAGQVVVAEEYDLKRDLTSSMQGWRTAPDCTGFLIEFRSEAQHTAGTNIPERNQK
jgi:hypothetical protein